MKEAEESGSGESISIADIVGPWVEPSWESGLTDRCRKAWSKPLKDLSREELATLLRQGIAVEYLLPVAKQKVRAGIDDGSKKYDGELEEAIKYAREVR